ncbi:MAG: hypothetical protein HY689_01155 [Chloroflexi bacterium]|nr:hypothetical protein [Chloroflexota bacterium]
MSNISYDVLTALQSKLEALAAYDIYMDDCEETGDESIRQVFERMRADDDRHVDLLRQTLEKMVREGNFR